MYHMEMDVCSFCLLVDVLDVGMKRFLLLQNTQHFPNHKHASVINNVAFSQAINSQVSVFSAWNFLRHLKGLENVFFKQAII